MKTLLLSVLLWLPTGDQERGLALYREGKFAEAAAAFRQAIATDGDSAELQWNLALASWRAGELAAAETAAEKYSAMSAQARPALHAGLLGAVRHDEAVQQSAAAEQLLAATPPAAPGDASPAASADPLPMFEQALGKANAARDHFVRGLATEATPELRRNLERTLRLIEALERRIEELKKQRDEQQKNESDDKKDDEKKKPEEKDEKSDEKKPKPDAKEQQDENGEQKPDQGEQQKPEGGEQKPDQGQPKPDPEQKPEPGESESESGEGKEGKETPEPKPQPEGKGDGKPEGEAKEAPPPAPEEGKEQKQEQGPPPGSCERQDAPGEGKQGMELSPEQQQRLLERLRDLEGKHKAARARIKSSRPKVERDW
jgi:Ca-activated chloride channel homolog